MKWIVSAIAGATALAVTAVSGPSAYEDFRKEQRQREAKDGLRDLFYAMRSNFGDY